MALHRSLVDYGDRHFGNGDNDDESVALLLNARANDSSFTQSGIHAPTILLSSRGGSQISSMSDNSDEQRHVPLFHFIRQNPNEAPPPGQLTQVRRVAMKNFLALSGGDHRPKRRSRREGSSTPGSQDSPPQELKRKSIRPRSIPVTDLTEVPVVSLAEWQTRGMVWSGTLASRCSPFRPTAVQTIYLARSMRDVQFIPDGLQGRLNQFNEWPSFDFAEGEIERLKYSCSQRFGSESLSQSWVPVLMESRNAFCSTICISAAHDELMEKENQSIFTRAAMAESFRRTAIRLRLIQMIKYSVSLGDTSDGNLIAILHVLFSEVMSGNQEEVRVHSKGLSDVINERGGLAQLGLQGRLAQTIVVVIYLAACTSETMPESMYNLYGNGIVSEPPPSDEKYLGSPIYASTAFCSLPEAQWDDMAAPLLELTRRATDAFYTMHRLSSGLSAAQQDASKTLQYCSNALLAFQRQTATTRTAGQNESIRLVCCTFVRALSLQVPLSQAVSGDVQDQHQIVLEFKESLKASSHDTCWESRSNVLLWCGIVMLAVANGLLLEAETQGLDQQELKLARDFIAAVTLRTAIKQIFGQTLEMLGMLKRLLRIQSVLSKIEVADEQMRTFGPSRSTELYQTFG